MDMINLIISLVSGVLGGNIAGAAAPDKSLGALGNSIAGLVGGGLGNFILQALGIIATMAATSAATGAPAAPGGLDIGTLIANVGGSGVCGAILTLIAGMIKNAMQK